MSQENRSGWMNVWAGMMLAAVLALAGCGNDAEPTTTAAANQAPAQPSVQAKQPAASEPTTDTKTAKHTLLVFGDSLSAAHNIPVDTSWPVLLEQQMQADGLDWRVVNASVSGETSRGGLEKIDAALAQFKPDMVFLELGANDGLRGQSIEQTQANLSGISQKIKASGARLVLVGIKMPPNYGIEYTQAFDQMYADLNRQYGDVFVPFFLAPIIERPELFQPDQLHPTEAAQPILAQSVYQVLQGDELK